MKLRNLVAMAGVGVVAIGILLSGGGVRAGSIGLTDSTTQPAENSSSPAEQCVRDLIKQLGDDSYGVRSAADSELRKMGPTILPLLEEAQQTDLEPEARTRVDGVIHSMLASMGKISPSEEWLNRRPTLDKEITGGRGAQAVDIHEYPGGINITYQDVQNGVMVERHASGIDPAHLRDSDPKAFEVYRKVRGHTDQASTEAAGVPVYQPHAGNAGARRAGNSMWEN